MELRQWKNVDRILIFFFWLKINILADKGNNELEFSIEFLKVHYQGGQFLSYQYITSFG
jgi:hypothetical protein